MYIHTITKVQASEQDLRSANPNVSFPSPFVPPNGYSFVFSVPQPTYNPVTQYVRQIEPGLTAPGHWEQRWEVVEIYSTAAERMVAIDVQVAAKFQAAKAAALLEIDRQNQVMHDQTIVNASIKDEYNAAYQAATAWLANQTLPAPTRVVSLAAKFGVSNLMAATIVKTKTEEGNAKLDARGAARLNGKTAIEAATTVDQVNTALAAGIAAMRAVSFTI